MITTTKNFLAALALVAMGSTVAVAQTDFGSPIGAGSGVGGSVAPLGVPNAENSGPGGGSGSALSSTGTAALAASRAQFMNAGASGLAISNPAGGTVTVPQNVARGLGAMLGCRATTEQVSAVSRSLTGVPATQSSALMNALTAFCPNADFNKLSAAVTAYNNALNAMPAGATPSPGMLAIRSALAAASRQ